MSESHSPPDSNDDELIQALAAFGEDAMDLLLDDDDLSDESLDCSENVLTDKVKTEPTDFASGTVIDSPEIRQIDICEDDSSLIRYTKELANSIYGGHSMPHQENRNKTGSSNMNRCIVFTVGQQPFAIPLSAAREIVRRPSVTSLPRTPNWLRGVTNLRGQIISVIDLRYLLAIDTDSADSSTQKTIVVHSQETNQTTSIVADRILGIRSLLHQRSDLSSLSAELQAIANAVATIDAGEIVLIDNDKLFEAASLTAASNQKNQLLTT